MCSRLKKVLYGFFIWFLRDFNIRLLKYCILGLKKVLYGFFYCFQGNFWSTKNENMAKLKKKRNNKKLLFLTTFFCVHCFHRAWVENVDAVYYFVSPR